MSDPGPFDHLPDHPRVREAATLLSAERLAELLADPQVREDLGGLLVAKGIGKGKIIGRLMQCGLYSEDVAPEKPPENRILDPSGTPYTQGKPLEKRKPRLITLAIEDVEAEEVEWLWPGRIPLGRVSVVMGRQGKGKSTLVSWLAATVSTGSPWPDCPDDNEAGGVLILQAEESVAQDLRPRLDAFGFARGRIQVIRGIERFDGDGKSAPSSFNLGLDVEALRAEIDRRGDVRLVIVDPLGSYIRGISGYNDTEVREYLRPLFEMAEECGVAVVLVAHPNKDQEKDILDRCSGSGAFTQMARMSWYFSDDPTDPGRRLLSLMKGNLHGATRTALAVSYDARSRRLEWSAEPVKLDAQQVDNLIQKMAREAKVKTRPGPSAEKTRKAEEFVVKQLSLDPCSLTVLKEKAMLVGVPFSTLRRALTTLAERKAIERYQIPPDDRTWFRVAEAPAEGGPDGPPGGGEGRAPRSDDGPR